MFRHFFEPTSNIAVLVLLTLLNNPTANVSRWEILPAEYISVLIYVLRETLSE